MEPSVYSALQDNDAARDLLFRALLSKLGLEVTEATQQPPPLAPLHLVSPDATVIEDILKKLEEVSSTVDGDDYVKGEADTFLIKQPESAWSMARLTRAALDVLSSTAEKTIGGHAEAKKEGSSESSNAKGQGIAGHISPSDYTNIIKTIIAHPQIPEKETTPHFNHRLYFSSLCQSFSNTTFGTPLLTTSCTTSTSTLLSANPTLTSRLPNGTTFTASTQLSGRGRGSNVWVSPPGALMFTTVFTHDLQINARAPVVFVQYLAAMAVVDAVTSYTSTNTTAPQEGIQASEGYEQIPVRLKWPNDIYALDTQYVSESPNAGSGNWREKYRKIGGILVNTSYTSGHFSVILGIGLNLSNSAPTTSLNTLISTLNRTRPQSQHLQPMSQERLLAGIMSSFGKLYEVFVRKGFVGELQERYQR
ncbi:MAG: hypothetical protein Q9159_005569, partial [Coniocarpon cinnabarinum]